MRVIVIIADSFRYDHLGANDNDWIHTPNLDGLAQQAVRFSRFYVEGLPTLPARQAYFTGRYTLPFRFWQSPEPGDPLLAEHLWDQGCATALVTDTYHMHKPGMTFSRGFDHVQFIRGQEYDPWLMEPLRPIDDEQFHRYRGDPKIDDLWRPRFRQYLRNIQVRQSERDWFAPQVVEAAIAWLERNQDRPDLFLWVDLFDPHEPWDPPAPFDTLYDPDYAGQVLIDPIPGPVGGYLTPEEMQHVAALYAGEVSFVDKWIGVLLEAIKALDMWDDTLLIFTSDHGEPLGERQVVRKACPWPYDEMSRVPFLIKLPGGERAGTVVDAFAQSPDLAPSICDLLGVPPLPGAHGQSLLPLARGQADRIRDAALSGWHGSSWSLRDDEWSFYLWLDGYPAQPWDAVQPGTRALYRLQDDPGEKGDVAELHPGVADRLELQLRRWIASLRWE
ncbi:MAG: sulfatase [Anaerolineae bacterium]